MADPETPETLTDRVLARVTNARIALERTSGNRRSREAESLRRVFRDLGISYRRYRSQTREPVKPELREAAYKFRADPSLTSLVAVAAYLDDMDLLS